MPNAFATSNGSSSTNCMPSPAETRRSFGLASPGCAASRRGCRARPLGHCARSGRVAALARAAGRSGDACRMMHGPRPGPRPISASSTQGSICLGLATAPPRARGNLRRDQGREDDARLRQYAGIRPNLSFRSCGGSTRTACRSRCITARSTRPSVARSRRRWRRPAKAVVCTSTLDLGVDWGDVDLVINVGAPKGASRLMQRIGRANHRLDEPSAPSRSRPTVSRCSNASPPSTRRVTARRTRRSPAPARSMSLCQHILGMACASLSTRRPVCRSRSAAALCGADEGDFDAALAFVATWRLCARSYERFAKIRRWQDGRWRVANGRVAQTYRLNVGTIVESDMLKVRLVPGGESRAAAYTGPLRRGGRVLGEIEEYFIEMLAPRDTFFFGGEILACGHCRERGAGLPRQCRGAKNPLLCGRKVPVLDHLAMRVRDILSDPASGARCPNR